MSNFDLTETQLLIQQTAREFSERELAPRAAEREHAGRFPAEELGKMAKLGLMGVNVSDKWGGAESGAVAYALAMMEISKGCASTGVTMAVTNMVAEIICEFGTDEQKRQHVTKITSGEYPAGAFALTEPGCGSDAARIKTRAQKTAKGWVLDGTKQFITSGAHAGVTVVWARTEDTGSKGISAFLVPQDTPGIHVSKPEKKMGLLASNTVSLTFEQAHIPDDALLGHVNQGFSIAMRALDGGRIGIASQSIGIAKAALEEAIRYAKQRETFGRVLSNHQAIQWMIADSATEIDAASLLTLRSAALKEQGRRYTLEASMAKLYASETANRVCARAFQIHGGYGYIKEYPIERYVRDARVTTIYEGTSEIQRLVIARLLLDA